MLFLLSVCLCICLLQCALDFMSEINVCKLYMYFCMYVCMYNNNKLVELVQEIGRRTTVITQDTRETVFLFQRLPIALQRGNAVSFLNTMNTE